MAWLNNKGLSLVGTLLAAFLLVTVGLAASQLAARSGRASASSREGLVASALAREGLELTRVLRDTNWFLRASDHRHWSQGLCEGEQFTIDAKAVRELDGVGDFENDKLFIANNGEWVHEATGRETPFRRRLHVDCRDKDVSFLVTAAVTWHEATAQERTWTISERLYDWLP